MDHEQPRIATALQQLREAHGISIAEMARRAGVSKGSMESYFRGHKPGYDALIAIADAFHVPTDFLCGLREIDVRVVDGRLVDATEPSGLLSEDIIERAARSELRSFLRFLVHLVERGLRPIKDGRVLSLTADEKAPELAKQIAWHGFQRPDEVPRCG